MANGDGRSQLIKYLEDVYVLESHLVQVLNDHARDAQNEPMIRQKIEQHLHETELHRDRIEQRLNALGAGKPGFKATVSNIIGQMIGSIAGSRTNTLAKNARDDYTSEQLEMASYVELITVAQAVGDNDTVRTAQLNLRDEVEMQQWLLQNLPEITLKGLQQEGVQVPANSLQAAQDIFADVGVGGFGAPPYQPPFQPQPPQQPPVS
jgi:ferritin-like metal-binding protein YciE